MGLDDFAPAHARQGEHSAPPRSVHPDDEDLFDFPSIEMKSTSANPAKAPAPAAHVTPVAPLPAKQPAIAKQPSTLGVATDVAPPRPIPDPHVTAASIAHIEAPAASIDGEDDEGAPETSEIAERRTIFARTPRLVWIAASVLLLVNSAGFLLLWSSNRSFHTAVDGLRDELAVAAHDMQASSVRSPIASPAVDSHASSTEHDASGLVPPRVPAFEETAIDLARREIELGHYAAARTRLYRLLAVADRIDPAVRADIEAHASFLVGESYAVEIDRRMEQKP